MKNLKIDLVYLWVDGNDKEWKKKKDFWAERLGIINNKEINNDCRFIDNEELKFSLRSAEMYAPWINKIFIVTDNQIPEWLDINNAKIKIVDHKDFIDKKYLPCFNSNAIEMCLDKIPDLSEHFLYANDDMFFVKSVTPEDFFNEKGEPIVKLRLHNWDNCNNLYIQNILYTTKLFHKKHKLDKILRKTEISHCIDAYKKSDLAECREVFKKQFEKTLSDKFRSYNGIQRIIYSFWTVNKYKNKYSISPIIGEQDYQEHVDNLCLSITSSQYIELAINTLSPKLLCINDNEYCNDYQRKSLRRILGKLFYKIPKWEITQNLEIKPIFPNKNAIVFSFNNQFCKFFSVALKSLIVNSNKDELYDIVVFNNDISENNYRLISKMLPKNFNLRFIDISEYIKSNFSNVNFKTCDKWSVEIYNRIFIPLLMSSYNKVLYLDSDIVINKNLNELFEMDDKGKSILAVKDTMVYLFQLKKYEQRLYYTNKIMGIKNEKEYFNSGVILFNLKNIDNKKYLKKLNKIFEVDDLYYPDQDILNSLFQNNIKFIDAKWNLCCGEFVYNKSYLNFVPERARLEYQSAIDFPCIIHYTSPIKPWTYDIETLFEIFWEYARKTPFYEEILYIMNRDAISKASQNNARYSSLYLKLNQDKKIALWGASKFLENYMKNFSITNENIVGIIDKNPIRKGEKIKNIQIYSPEDIGKLDIDEIIVTIVNRKQDRLEEIKKYIKNNTDKKIKVTTI